MQSCIVDLDSRRLWSLPRVNTLTEQESWLLRMLAETPGTVLPYPRIMSAMSGMRFAEPKAVDALVAAMRIKIEANPARPEHLFIVPGVGVLFDPGDEEAPRRFLRQVARRSNLHRSGAPFIGRRPSLARLAAITSNLLTVIGPPGVGKSALVRRYGESVFKSLHSHGHVYVIDAFDTKGASGLVTRIAHTLWPAEPYLEDPLALVDRLASEGDILLIVDDVAGEDQHAALNELAESAPAVRVCATSRERPVHGNVLRLAPLGGAEMSRLLRSLTRAERGPWARPDGDAIARILPHLNGLPLAAVLAARHARMLPPSLLARCLEENGSATIAQPLARPGDRHGSLDTELERSWLRLRWIQQHALGKLASCDGDFGPREAFELGIGDGPVECSTRLAELWDHSLIQRVPHHQREKGKTYRMLRCVRQFTTEAMAAYTVHQETERPPPNDFDSAEWLAHEPTDVFLRPRLEPC